MQIPEETQKLFGYLTDKGTLKQDVYQNTLQTLNLLKASMREMIQSYHHFDGDKIPFEYKDRGEFEAELRFAGDVLVFFMHTNVFEMPRDHDVMKTSYIQEDRTRSFCGIIHIFNFLNDSFKYNRKNDVGYLIGRIFINKDMHYFIEGKREIGYLYNSFGNAVMNEEKAGEIIQSSIKYTLDFDLLTPHFEDIKMVYVHDFLNALDAMQLKTGKRLGFRFQADNE